MTRWMTPVALALLSACAAHPPVQPGPAPAEPQPPAPRAEPAPAPEAVHWPPDRPIPYAVVPPAEFRGAVAAGTRTDTGVPGPRYWTNNASYDIHVRLYPEDRRLEGSETVEYRNNSPDTLDLLVMNLTQNFSAPGAVRAEPTEITGGVELGEVAVGGETLHEGSTGAYYEVDGTKLYILPSQPLLPGDSVDVNVAWSFNIPEQGASGRMGYDDDNLFFLGYFYPQIAVYDDVAGWAEDDFRGTGEFYADFATYDVAVEAPAGWVVMGTGVLTNAADVLAAPVLERFRAAAGSDTIVHVLTTADFDRATRSAEGTLSWTFHADSVHDVAFSATRQSIWDAARTPVGDRDGDGQTDYVRVDAFYRQPAVRWKSAARYAQFSISFLSRYTGLSYPWPHMTAVEGAGIIGGGMEYPMMTLIGAYTTASDSALYGVIAHEFSHMWVPMTVATNERRYGWMDEGIADFNENEAYKAFYPGTRPELNERNVYLNIADAGQEEEMMRRSDYYYSSTAYVIASYMKPATVLVTLRALLGEETFNRAYREFYQRWKFRHPYPWDLWNTFERVSGEDLGWFWRSWYYETWLLDQSVQSVVSEGDSTRITVRDVGNVPMPASLEITLGNGSTITREIPVDAWLGGSRVAVVTVPGAVGRVEIDPANEYPDADRSNNVWTGP